MATVTAEVTQEDIEEGLRSCRDCPVARAINRVVHPNVFVEITQTTISFYERETGSHIKLTWTPKVISEFVRDFDNCDLERKTMPAPFSFDLDIPESVPLRKVS